MRSALRLHWFAALTIAWTGIFTGCGPSELYLGSMTSDAEEYEGSRDALLGDGSESSTPDHIDGSCSPMFVDELESGALSPSSLRPMQDPLCGSCTLVSCCSETYECFGPMGQSSCAWYAACIDGCFHREAGDDATTGPEAGPDACASNCDTIQGSSQYNVFATCARQRCSCNF